MEKAILWSERCVGMVGTYATILRQRGDYTRCEEVVYGWYTKVLNIYKAHVERDMRNDGNTMANAMAMKCLHGLTYKYLVVKMNLIWNMQKHSLMTASDLRYVIRAEFKDGLVASDNDNYAWMMEAFLDLPLKIESL